MNDERSSSDYPSTWRMILDRLDQTSKRLDSMSDDLTELKVDIAILRTKITIFAAVGGSVTGTITSVIIALVMHAYK